MVGKVDEEGAALVETAYRCLASAVDMVQPGAMYRDLGGSIGKIARERGERAGGSGTRRRRRVTDLSFVCRRGVLRLRCCRRACRSAESDFGVENSKKTRLSCPVKTITRKCADVRLPASRGR